ncbi:OprD family outer membrane porin [Endozoicomonas sp. SCSIO W0465]|uniref:OprD family outer membrane porin n=1 Tax=Endozoicomonas sp. SCSIO W0465 TaxID=2918516 RepID=UPI0020752532|nr:OprD family outer membrane porin [Endozoicomonas sp. SCSIO W0465]USE34760.1 OprD family outer membrane porin [Endozoicomonas sp. SCSIO W0465]
MRLYPCVVAWFLSLSLFNFSAHGDAAATDAQLLELDGKLRTVFYNVDNLETNKRTGAWTTALWLDGQITPLTDDLVLGAGFFSVARLELADSDGCSSRCSYQLLNDANEGFAKLGQAYVRLQVPLSESDKDLVSLTIGRQILKTGLISGSSSRSVPSSWQGYNLKMAAGNLQLGLALVNRMSLRNQAGFHRLTNFPEQNPEQNQVIDYIIGGEVFYRMPVLADSELFLAYRNGFAKDYLQAHNLDVLLTTFLDSGRDLSLGVRYFHTEKDGDLWQGTGWGGSPLFDDYASVINVHGRLSMPSGWSFDAAISHYNARSSVLKYGISGYAPPGSYYYDLGANTHGFWNIHTNGIAEDMMYDGETVMKAGITYDFSSFGIKGLNAGYAFHYGSGMRVTTSEQRQVRVSEYEHDVFMVWYLPEPLPKGLTFKLKFGLYHNDPALRQAINKEENDLRIWLDYDFAAF